MTLVADSAERLNCTVLASGKQAEMYLYLAEGMEFAQLPEALRNHFGLPRPVLTLELHPQRRLARVGVVEVMAALHQQGFYLQMPPQIEAELYQAQI